MSDREHRFEVSESNLVSRHLKLQPTDKGIIEAAVADIGQLPGVDSIAYNEKKRMLNFSYDAAMICIDDIEEVLNKHAVEVGHSWWNRFKEGYYRFSDQNVKDNATHDPVCCNQIPPGFKRKR